MSRQGSKEDRIRRQKEKDADKASTSSEKTNVSSEDVTASGSETRNEQGTAPNPASGGGAGLSPSQQPMGAECLAGVAGLTPRFIQAQTQALLHQQQQMMANMAMFGGYNSFATPMYNPWNTTQFGGQEWELASQMSVDDELSRTLSGQHEISDEDSSDGEIQNGGQTGVNKNKDKTETELPPLKEGALAAVFKEDQDKILTQEVGKPVNPHIARSFDQCLSEKFDKKKYETLTSLYAGVSNIPKLIVQKTDEEIFLELPPAIKTLDKDLQDIQEGVVAGLAAIAPLLHEILDRGKTDEPLDKLSTTVMDGVKALTMTNAYLITKRNEIHKPYMKSEFIRAIGKVKDEDKDPKWLYGKAVEMAVATYEKTKKAARGAMKDTQLQTKKNTSTQQVAKKAKYHNKPQTKPPGQNSFGGYHYSQQGAPQFTGPQNFNPNYLGKNFIPNYRQTAPNTNYQHRPRQPAPPATSNPGQGFQKKPTK